MCRRYGGAPCWCGSISNHKTRYRCPYERWVDDGLDSLLSTVQMPGGMLLQPAVGKAGATNAAYLAMQIMALSDEDLAAKLSKDKEKKAKAVEEDSATIEKRI